MPYISNCSTLPKVLQPFVLLRAFCCNPTVCFPLSALYTLSHAAGAVFPRASGAVFSLVVLKSFPFPFPCPFPFPFPLPLSTLFFIFSPTNNFHCQSVRMPSDIDPTKKYSRMWTCLNILCATPYFSFFYCRVPVLRMYVLAYTQTCTHTLSLD